MEVYSRQMVLKQLSHTLTHVLQTKTEACYAMLYSYSRLKTEGNYDSLGLPPGGFLISASAVPHRGNKGKTEVTEDGSDIGGRGKRKLGGHTNTERGRERVGGRGGGT